MLAPALPAALLVAIALWQVAATACSGRGVPSEEDWERAAAHVREHRESNELIVFAPDWLDPVGRLHLGDQIPVDMAARMDAAGYAGIWELSARGARAAEARDLEPARKERFGALSVRYYAQEPAEVVTDFLAEFSTAKVEGDAAGRPRVVLDEVDFRPRRCVRAEPAPGGEVRIVFPDAKLGERLVGYAGLADIFTLRDVRDPGFLRVLIAGEEVASLELGIHDGWVRFEVDTAAQAGADVEIVASASAPDRQICFAMEARQ